MNVPRMRMIAGPNGSGKTTLMEYLRQGSFPLGFCQNPDEIEAQINQTGRIGFDVLGLKVSREMLVGFLGRHPLGGENWKGSISVRRNILSVKRAAGGGYFAAVLSDFIRQSWLDGKQGFTFETVMSDKIELMKRARRMGYRTYLYCVCTNSAMISLERVALRVARGGHDVP
jgi:predicted ABC-type ATPase